MELIHVHHHQDKIEEESKEQEDSDSISSEEEGAGLHCVHNSRLKPIKDLWFADEIVSGLESMKCGESIGKMVCSGNLETLEEQSRPVAVLWASWLGKPAILQKLITSGVNPNTLDLAGRSALHLSALVGSDACVKILLEAGAKPSEWDFARRGTPLHCAASSKSLGCLQLLIRYGADLNAGITDRSPLHYAVQSEAVECVRTLLKAGARPDTPQVYTETPLHVAAALGASECLRILLEHGADAKAKLGAARLTALHLAAEEGHTKCARLLLDNGAPVDARNFRLQTPLHLACVAQSIDILELLVERGANTRIGDCDGRTPLHAALGRTARGSESARVLLRAKADPNAPDNYGYTPLHLAALNEFSNSVMLLLDNGGDVTARTKGGQTALSFITRRTPDVLPLYIQRFDDAVFVVDHEIGDVDCELRVDFGPLAARSGKGETALLLTFVEVGRQDLLKHPLCETFLYLKWRRIRKFFLSSLAFHAAFVILFTIYIIGVFLRNCPSTRASFLPITCHVKIQVKIVGYILIILNFLLMSKEIFQLCHGAISYVKQWENWLQWAIIIGVFLCAMPGTENDVRIDVASWQHHVAAITIFAAWAELMLIVGRFPMFGLYVQMFTTVAVNFSKFLMAYSCLLIAFGLCFGVLFANYPSFHSALSGLLKAVIMMAGELEFEDIFYNETDKYPMLYPVTAHIFFLAFVLLVTVILTNLLVGLAVNDIQTLQETAGLERLVRQAGLVARLESMLFSRLLTWLPQKLLATIHRSALLLASPYRKSITIRPNDPREHRIPKELLASLYKLVADRKEQLKTTKTNRPFRNACRKSKYGSVYSGNDTAIQRLRTTSDASQIKQSRSEDVLRLQIQELADSVTRLQADVKNKFAAIESAINSLK